MRGIWSVCVVAAGASALSAAVVNYPALDASFSAPGSQAVSTVAGPVTLDVDAGRFTDPDTGTASASATRYYGGIISYSPNTDAQWGGGIDLLLTREDNATVRFGKGLGGTTWTINGSSSSYNSGIAATGEMPFVIKVVDIPWNVAEAKLFLGANATAMTEGTPDGSVNVINATASGFIRDARVTFVAENWASGASSGSIQGFFSATEWQPAVVPEPHLLGVVGASGLLMLRRRKV